MCGDKAGFFDFLDLVEQHQPQFGIFVANVNVSIGRLDDPGGNQHAFNESMRIAFEIVAVLEGAGLTFVGVDRKQARRGLGTYQ